MACHPLPGGGFVCTGHSRRRSKPCACGAPSTRLCDFPLKGKKTGKTCDAPICDRCAAAFGDEIDYCPPHAKLAAAAVTAPPAPLTCQDASVLTCETCGGKSPRCDRCLDDLVEQLAGVCAVRGERWGAEVRLELARRIRPAAPWPDYDADDGEKLRAIAKKKMADVAGADETLLERLARRCAAAAARAYGGT